MLLSKESEIWGPALLASVGEGAKTLKGSLEGEGELFLGDFVSVCVCVCAGEVW